MFQIPARYVKISHRERIGIASDLCFIMTAGVTLLRLSSSSIGFTYMMILMTALMGFVRHNHYPLKVLFSIISIWFFLSSNVSSNVNRTFLLSILVLFQIVALVVGSAILKGVKIRGSSWRDNMDVGDYTIVISAVLLTMSLYSAGKIPLPLAIILMAFGPFISVSMGLTFKLAVTGLIYFCYIYEFSGWNLSKTLSFAPYFGILMIALFLNYLLFVILRKRKTT